ncbi:hypothetical protein [Bradyrhizobium sp.]|uniref:hypothetical protein n=1 Tax=Bradyrhizobium sp. TaxID=376 RepID=UPI002BA292F1|nr:hypothetical protein [Bradyrhizobium sp.]HMM92962.1 hypothetical protein [Bradyrhizobium sp.]
MVSRTLQFTVLLAALAIGAVAPALAQSCTRQGTDVTCDDGRRGIFSNDAIVWADGTQSRLASPHPSVIIGNKSSVVIGPGVFAGNGKGGYVPMENPSAPNKARCPVLDGASYCY